MADIAKTLSMIPLIPTSFSPDFKQITLKTIPSASKLQIKHTLESSYNLEVHKIQTLNVKGKSKNRSLVAKPDYKKAYVTLKKPIPFSNDLFPVHTEVNAVDDDDENKKKTVENQC